MPPLKSCAGITAEVEDKHIQAANVRECLLAQLLHTEAHAPLPSKPKTKLSGDHSVYKFGHVQVLSSRHRPIQRLVSQTGLYWEGLWSNPTSESFPMWPSLNTIRTETSISSGMEKDLERLGKKKKRFCKKTEGTLKLLKRTSYI